MARSFSTEVKTGIPTQAVFAPGSTFGKAAHFDQIGRVTGAIEINGEHLDIDCWSMRDRTWGRRPENRPRQAAYVTGADNAGDGFLAVTNTRDGRDPLSYGFVRHGGVVVALVEGQRKVERHPEHGWVESIHIEATDATGAQFSAHGRAMNRIIINRHTFIDVNSLIAWTVDGSEGADVGSNWFGEDQDMWPVHRWSAANRAKDWSIPQ